MSTRAAIDSVPAPGARLLGGGRAAFVLWAPDAHAVTLLLRGGSLPMRPVGGGHWSIEAPARGGDRYLFRIDDGPAVPDPASRWQPQDVDGASALLAADGFRWRHEAWQGRPWHEAVVYEVHAGASGGWDGVRAQLPRLAALGITAIELMPVAECAGTRNWGYDGVLPFAPSAACGTPDGLKALVDGAHGHGLMVLLDVVYNHFGPMGNHLGRYARAFFRDDGASPWGQAIDFRRPQVRRYFIDNALQWLLEYRFDGLRLDAVHAIDDDGFLRELREAVRAAVPAGRHVHLVLENERNQASLLDDAGYTAQWNDDFHNALHVLATGESEGYYAAFADDPARHFARVLGEGFAFQGEADHRGHARGEPSAHLSPLRFVAFAQNHDQVGNRAHGERLRTLAGDAATRVAMAVVALCPMVPLFFMGEPWGAREPFLFFTDFPPPLDAQVREGRRREFASFAAFADADARAAIPDPNAAGTFEASRVSPTDADRGDGAAWAAWFTTLLALRREHLQPRLAAASPLGAVVIGPRALDARWTLGDRELRIVLNFGEEPVDIAPWPADALLHAENAGDDPATGLLPSKALRAWLRPSP